MENAPAPVVVGVDGSVESREAARLGAFEARARGTRLELLTALPPTTGRRPAVAEGIDVLRMVRAATTLLLDGVADEVSRRVPEVPVATHVRDGRPADVLLHAAAHAALVVVGSRSTGAIGDAFLGSTALAVVRAAPCPALVVPLRPGTAVYGRAGVVVGVAGEPGDDAVLAFAFAAAAARATNVTAVHTWRHPFPGPAHLALDPFVDDASARRREEDVLSDALQPWTSRMPGVTVREVVEHERPAAALVAASLTADLLVVGHRHRPTGTLASVTAAVVHRAECPVAVVPLPARRAQGRQPEPVSRAARA